MDVPLGHDNAADARAAVHEPRLTVRVRAAEQETETVDGIDDGHDFLQVSMPSFSTGITTFAYQRALRNRILNDKLRSGGEISMSRFTPTFIHDCLMLPGSLSNLLMKESPEDVLSRMTPALLPGFHAHVHCDTAQPCIMQSTRPTDFVEGMLVFGLSKTSRKLIHRHYRPNTRRVKLSVEVDVVVKVPLHERSHPDQNWRLQRRHVWAHAWIWSNVGSVDVHFPTTFPRWSLEDYIGGAFEPEQKLRIEPTAKGDEGEKGEVDFVYESDNEMEHREVVYGGCGELDYERVDYHTGW